MALSVITLLRRAIRRMHQVGIRQTFREFRRRLLLRHAADPFDAIHGTDTASGVPLWRLALSHRDAAEGVGYLTRSEDRICRALEGIPRQATLVDLGCGKGRVLIVAHELGFARIVGVEFAPQLARIAGENLRLTGTPAEVVEQSAADFDLPSGLLAIYLYNPFGVGVFQAVMNRLQQHKGPLWISYLNADSCPGCRQLLEKAFGPPSRMEENDCFWGPVIR